MSPCRSHARLAGAGRLWRAACAPGRGGRAGRCRAAEQRFFRRQRQRYRCSHVALRTAALSGCASLSGCGAAQRPQQPRRALRAGRICRRPSSTMIWKFSLFSFAHPGCGAAQRPRQPRPAGRRARPGPRLASACRSAHAADAIRCCCKFFATNLQSRPSADQSRELTRLNGGTDERICAGAKLLREAFANPQHGRGFAHTGQKYTKCSKR